MYLQRFKLVSKKIFNELFQVVDAEFFVHWEFAVFGESSNKRLIGFFTIS